MAQSPPWPFDVIVHGCNCFCTMRRGVAPQMARAFHCDSFPMEAPIHKGDINKLGTIDYKSFPLNNRTLQVVNAYTQYHYNWNSKYGIPLDYDALRMCMRKIGMEFQGARVGLPKIGAGVAGGDWGIIENIIQDELQNCNITIINYEPNTLN